MMYPEGNRLLPDDVLRDLGVVAARPSLRTPYFMSTPRLIAETDLVICVPRPVADRLASLAEPEIIPLPNSPNFLST